MRDVRIIADRNSRRSKGIAYVEFVDIQSVALAIGLTGQRLLGVPIIVQASQVSLVVLFYFILPWDHMYNALGPMEICHSVFDIY